ncbi:hypothetical protein JCM5296_000408 [Sporobolomyces johnsonii]
MPPERKNPNRPPPPPRSSIKLGTTSHHTPSELLANLVAVLPYIATRIPNAPASFDNVQSLHVKTSTSTALPIYNSTLEDRFKGVEMTADERAEVERKKAEKEQVKREKEQRKKERSATREGKGRLEKKRTAEDEEEKAAEADAKAEAEVESKAEAPKAEDARPSKKAKKAKK